jgi:hypothetical protein
MFNSVDHAPDIDNSLLINYLATLGLPLFRDNFLHARFLSLVSSYDLS